MANTPTFESPITSSYPVVTGALILSDESAVNKLLIRADADTAAARRLDVPYGRCRMEGAVHVCGQRPTEWLLVGDAAEVAAFASSLDRSGHVSLIDHTHARAMFRLTGADSTKLLEKVCSLDWSDAMTPDGAAVSASVAKTNCDITRNDLGGTPSYRIACDRSFGQYLFDAILDAGDEFGIGVGA